MRDKILLIRSVSFQQLDKNFPEIIKKFPNCEFHILTHSHGIENCKKYKGIKNVINYEKTGDFNPLFLDKKLKNKFDKVIFFVSNIEGKGFTNVSLLAARLSKKEVFRCNLNSEIVKISKKIIFLTSIKSLILFPTSAFLTLLLSPLILPLIIIILGVKKRK